MTLEVLYRSLWQALELGVLDPAHAYHLGVLATHGANARSVVLRSASAVPAQILIYSDRRAPKITEIEIDPRATLVVYGDRRQLRLRGRLSIHRDDALGDTCWEACPLSSRRAYLTADAPGTALNEPQSGLPAGLDQRPPTLEESAAGRANFAVLELRIDAIDCLLLDPSGYRRAIFRVDASAVTSSWCIP